MTPEVAATILDAIKAGTGIDTAAKYAGVSDRTVRNWIACGRAARQAAEENDAPIPIESLHLADFSQEVDTARALAVARNITVVQGAATSGPPILDRQGRPVYDDNGNIIRGPGDWRAAAWWLEHAHPDEYGAHRVEVTGRDGGPLESLVIGQVDVQVALDNAADPRRSSAIGIALAQAGLFGAAAAIEASATDADSDS